MKKWTGQDGPGDISLYREVLASNSAGKSIVVLISDIQKADRSQRR